MNSTHSAWMKSLTRQIANGMARQSKAARGFSRWGNGSGTLLEPLEDRCLFSGVLGTAAAYAVLGGTTVTNTGLTAVVGSVGVSPGTAITGFPPGTFSGGTINADDGSAVQAQADLATAYGVISGEASIPANNLSGQDLGGMTLFPGVYHFNTAAQLTGTLTLDAQGDPNARFDFQIGSTLTTASNSAVNVINGGIDDNVYFQVGSSATLGTNSAFEGNILAHVSVTLNTGASLGEGRALAELGAVTLDTNQVSATEADVSVTSSISSGTVLAGNAISYTVTIANAGPNTAQNVSLSDAIPAGTTFVSDAQTSGPAFTLTSPSVGGTGTVGGTISTFASGGSATFTVLARVPSNTASGTSIVSTPTVSTTTYDPNLANDSVTLTSSVQTKADVSLTNTAASSSVVAGNTISYTINISNAGPSDAHTVTLSDLVPANTTFVSASQTSGSAFNLTTPAVGGSGTISAVAATLVSGGSADFNVVVLVTPGTPVGTAIVNSPNVTLTTTDPNLVNNTQTVTTTVRVGPPTVTGVSPNQGPIAGGTLVTIAGTNLENATAVDFGSVAVTSFVSDSSTQIVLLSPAGAAGTVDVTAITPGGTSAVSALDRFAQVTAPTFTSQATGLFSAGLPGTFLISTAGFPTPAVTSSALPAGLMFVDNGNGTATVSGTPAVNEIGNYSLTFTATNGVLPNATQLFTLTVQTAPTLVSLTISAPANTVAVVGTLQFTAIGTDGSGSPTALGPVTWSLDTGSVGSIDQNGLFTAGGAGGTAIVRATSGGKSATKTIAVTSVVPGTQPTRVLSVQPVENGQTITSFVVTFTGPVDPTSAQDVRGYRILRQTTVRRGRNFWEHLFGKNAGTETINTAYRIASAVYDPQTNSVTVTPASPMPMTSGVRLLEVIGTGVHAVLDANEKPIDGDANGKAGGNFGYRFTMSVAKSVSYTTTTGEAVKLSLSGPGEIVSLIPSGTKTPIIDLIGTDLVGSILTGTIRKGHNSVAYAVLDELNGSANADIQLGNEFHVNQE